MSHLTLEEGGPGQNSKEELASLLERGLENGFRLTDNHTLSSIYDTERRLKNKRKPLYRKIKRYYKSIEQYKKERERRRKVLHLWMVEFQSQKEIAKKLGVSVSTVKRDQKKLRRYVRGQNNRAIRLMQAEQHAAFQKAMEGLSLGEQFDYLSAELEKYRKFGPREYKGHYSILYLDLTQPGPYGVPKLTMLPKQTRNSRLAYPHKVRVHVKTAYEGKIFEVDIGGFTIIQTRSWRW